MIAPNRLIPAGELLKSNYWLQSDYIVLELRGGHVKYVLRD